MTTLKEMLSTPRIISLTGTSLSSPIATAATAAANKCRPWPWPLSPLEACCCRNNCRGVRKRQCRRGCRWRGGAGCMLFCGLIWAESKRCCRPGLSYDPSPENLGNIFSVGDKWPITIDGADVDADLVTKVWCASLMRPHCRRLLAL
jgi:hypothetical protein